MTSKEIIENELKFLKHNLEKAKKEKVIIAIKQIEREIKRKEQVLKDLEVLDILKPYIEISSDGIISCHNLILTPYYKYYEEQYNLLKEWLGNDK